MKLAQAVCVLALCAGASGASADPSEWRDIGIYPYAGDVDTVCRLHGNVHGLSVDECLRGVAMLESGQCQVRYLENGEVLWTSFTRDRYHAVEEKVVAFSHHPTHLKRLVDECDLGNGVLILYPRACGNWSVQYQSVETTGSLQWQCWYENQTPPTATSVGTYVRGIALPDCNCGSYTYYDDFMSIIESTPIETAPQLMCGWR